MRRVWAWVCLALSLLVGVAAVAAYLRTHDPVVLLLGLAAVAVVLIACRPRLPGLAATLGAPQALGDHTLM